MGPFMSAYALQEHTRCREYHGECQGCNFHVCVGFAMEVEGMVANSQGSGPKASCPTEPLFETGPVLLCYLLGHRDTSIKVCVVFCF